MVTIKRTGSDDSDFQDLVKLLDKELHATYGELQKSYDQFNIIENIPTVVIVYEEGVPAGCGCFWEYEPGVVEIKRMFVKNDFRGKSISKLILNELETWAKELNFKSAILETGLEQKAAISLYKKQDYKIIENYGQYTGNPNSLCMRKLL